MVRPWSFAGSCARQRPTRACGHPEDHLDAAGLEAGAIFRTVSGRGKLGERLVGRAIARIVEPVTTTSASLGKGDGGEDV
jgi:hypothetical protein